MKLSFAKIFGVVFALTAFGSYALDLSSLPPGAEQTIQRLPDWLKPLYGHGLLATVDSGGEVASIIASRIVNDELLAKLKTLPKLRELHIDVTKDITPAGLALLAEMRTLEKLSLYQVNAEGTGLGDVAIRSASGCPRYVTSPWTNAAPRMPVRSFSSGCRNWRPSACVGKAG